MTEEQFKLAKLTHSEIHMYVKALEESEHFFTFTLTLPEEVTKEAKEQLEANIKARIERLMKDFESI